MKLKIISDGTTIGAKIVDAESGETLDNVAAVSIYAVAGRPIRVVLNLMNTEINLYVQSTVTVNDMDPIN
jgi:hypothetical protein